MAGKTDYYSDLVLGVLENTALSGIANVYVALFTAAPTDAYTSAARDGTEISYGTGAREEITSWNAKTDGGGRHISNDDPVEWTGWDGGSGTVTHFGIFDSSGHETGNLLYWGALTTSRAIGAGETASFADGALVIQED